MAPLARIAVLPLLSLIASGCMQFSPFETDLEPSQRDHTLKNLRALAEQSPRPGPWKLAAIADSHASYEELEELVDILNERGDLDLVLHAGDSTEFGLRQEYLWSLERLRALDMPWLTVIGNHDALSNGDQIYRGMFGAYDYAFEWGGVRFVCFNTNRLEFGSSVPDWDFVEAQSFAPEGGGLVLLTHVPPGASELGEQPRYASVLARSGLLFSVHGHHHTQTVAWLDRAPSVTVGATRSMSYMVATIDGSRAEVELCSGRICKPLEARP